MTRSPRLLPLLGSFIGSLALGCAVASCSDAQQPATDLRIENPDLSVGVYGECELPSGLQGIVGNVTAALGDVGIELGAEVIFVYDYDLASSAQTLELLIGGSVGTDIAKYVGAGAEEAVGEASSGGGPGGGVLVSATVPVNWSGSLKDITWGVDAYGGAEIFGGEVQGGGGTWKVVWSSNSSDVGESGYWGSAGGSIGGTCSAGGVVFTSNSDLCVIKGWLGKIFGSSSATSCNDAGSDAGDAANTEAGEGGDAGGGDGGSDDAAASDGGSSEGGGEDGGSADDGGNVDGGGFAGPTTCDNSEKAAPGP
jgi:hypothetical protein